MNKNKIIFGILGAIVLALFVFGILALRTSNNTTDVANTGSNAFSVWLV
jgi:hypothetical protein